MPASAISGGPTVKEHEPSDGPLMANSISMGTDKKQQMPIEVNLQQMAPTKNTADAHYNGSALDGSPPASLRCSFDIFPSELT